MTNINIKQPHSQKYEDIINKNRKIKRIKSKNDTISFSELALIIEALSFIVKNQILLYVIITLSILSIFLIKKISNIISKNEIDTKKKSILFNFVLPDITILFTIICILSVF